MLRQIGFTSLSILLLPAWVSAKPMILNLEDVVYLALRNNATVQQANIGRIAQKFSVLVAKYQFQPQYTLTSSYAGTNSQSNGESSNSNTFGLDGGVQIENHYGTVFSTTMNNALNGGHYNPGVTFKILQPLIRGFGKPVVMAELEDALDSEAQNRLNYKQTAMTTLVAALQNYFNLVEADQSLSIAKASLKQNQQTVDNDKRLIEAGKMAGSDIVQAQAQVASAEASIEQEKNAVETAKNNLLNTLGLGQEVNIGVPDTFNFANTVNLLTGNGQLPDLAYSQKIALQNNTNYRVSAIAIQSLARGVLLAEDQNKPQLNLTGTVTRGAGSGGGKNAGLNSLVNNHNYSNEVDVNLDVPIANVSNQGAIVQAKVGLDQAKIALAETKRQLLSQVKTDYMNLQLSYNQLVASRRALALQRRNYEINNELLLAGKISNFQLLTLQSELINAENAVVTNQINYLTAIANYEDELGIALDPWHVNVRY